jgi:regulatory protein
LKPKSEFFNPEIRQHIIDMLPVRITSLEVQKNDSNRVSVCGNDRFLFGISINASQKLGLQTGKVIDLKFLGEIESVAHYDSIRTWLIILLGKKPYSRFQLAQKCKMDGYPSAVYNKILDEIESRGWLDDEAFARAYANDKFRFQKWGPQKIRLNLLQKGVSDSVSKAVISELIDDNDQIEMLKVLIDKKKNHFLREPDLLKRKKKAVNYLLGKGYDQNIVFSSYEKLIQELQI